jgi:hypothetical protein
MFTARCGSGSKFWVTVLPTLCMVTLSFAFTGCSQSDRPPLGRVTGKVTFEGQPLAGVIVNFQPDSGRAGTCETDAQGNYDLIYTYQVKGAKVGMNTVSFAWPTGAEGKRAIPDKYGVNSDIKFEVKSGRNTFDIDLKAK